MKPSTLLRSLPLWLASAGPLAAFPYATRPVTIGMDAATVSGTGVRISQTPVAAAVEGGPAQQWYAGGALMTKAPWPGSVQLPAIVLPQTPTATVRPLAGTVCDIDRDGDMDVVRINEWVGNLYLYTLQVFLNNGSESFSLGYRVDWVNAPGWNEGQHFFEIAAADFNRDGRPDLAILETYNHTNTAPNPNREEGRLLIRWHEGSAQFNTVTTVKATSLDAKSRLSVADCDRDGDQDIVCSYSITWPDDDDSFPIGTHTPLLFRNDGTGTFTETKLGGRPHRFVDLNHDGWPDLADSTAVALNDGAGNFAASVTELASAVEAYTFADTNRDGRLDLVRCEGTNLVAYAGNGLGGFAAAGQTVAALGGSGIALAAADSDRDGDDDFFVTLAAGGFVLVENRAFHHAPGAAYHNRQSLAGVTQLLTGDFFLDGSPDVLAVTPSQEKLWFLDGNGNHAFSAAVFKNTQGVAPHSAAVADFNADGRPDVAYSLPSDGTVRVARNTEAMIPFTWPDAAIATGLGGVSHLVTGSRGGFDGFPDLLSSSATTGQIRWHYPSGAAWTTQSILTPFSPPAGALLADQATNAPGDEIFTLAADASSLSLRAHQALFGYGSLGTDRNEGVSNGGPHATKMVRVDTNGDGTAETVYISGDGGLSSWNPVTAAASSLPALPAAIRDLAAVDWDRDGRTDILCATASGLYLVYYDVKNYGWVQVRLFDSSVSYQAVAAADFNHDGWPDAVAATATEIHHFRNLPFTGTAHQHPTDSTLTVNTSGLAASWRFTTQARASTATNGSEPTAVCTGTRLQFSRADFISGSWVPGAPLTASELSSVVSAVRLVAGAERTVIGSSGPGALENLGLLDIEYHPILGNLAPITSIIGEDIAIELVVRADALQSPHTRFFLQALGFTGAPQDGLASIIPGEGAPFRIRNSRAALVTIAPAETPLQAWRRFHWNSAASTGPAANDADPDGDGVANLVEYLTGTNPVLANPATNLLRGLTLLPLPTSQTPVKLRLVLSNAALADPNVKVTLLAGSALAAWPIYTTRTGGGSWTHGVTPQAISSDNGTTTTHLFTLPFTPTQTPHHYFALRIEELP
jgi:hypothetical protein